jgi:hypothetical protein
VKAKGVRKSAHLIVAFGLRLKPQTNAMTQAVIQAVGSRMGGACAAAKSHPTVPSAIRTGVRSKAQRRLRHGCASVHSLLVVRRSAS